jgi:hypothetical protein
MTIPPELKFDVRVRERFMDRGLLKASEVEEHLSALVDVGEQAVEVAVKQPALQTEGDRDVVIVKTSAASRAPVAPIRRDDDLDTPIDDDDDDDDDLDMPKPKAAAPAAAAPAAAPEKPAADADAAVDDDDDDDDDDAEDGGAAKAGEGSEGGASDGGWGDDA